MSLTFSFSEKNLAKEAEIEVLRSDLSAKLATVTEKRSTFKQKAQRQQEILKVRFFGCKY